MEVDFKAECTAGDTVQSSVMQLPPPPLEGADGNGVAAVATGRPVGDRQFLHSLLRCKGGSGGTDCTELVRARSTWRLTPVAAAAAGN